MNESEYALGHAEAELRRLTTQAKLIDPITRRFFQTAGIAPGMRILDVGSGAGDVALMCAEIVGPSGRVVGTDLSLAAIARARERAEAMGVRSVSFRHGDPSALEFDEPFDAVVGRYVLQFMPDPGHSLSQIARRLRAGGIVVFHELDWDGARSSPPSSTYARACACISRTIEAAGAEIHMGTRLASVFSAAGLPSPLLRMESVIGAGAQALEVAHLVTDLIATQLPTMQSLGIAKAEEIDHPTLASRILAEIGPSGTLIGRLEVGAWTTVT